MALLAGALLAVAGIVGLALLSIASALALIGAGYFAFARWVLGR